MGKRQDFWLSRRDQYFIDINNINFFVHYTIHNLGNSRKYNFGNVAPLIVRNRVVIRIKK